MCQANMQVIQSRVLVNLFVYVFVNVCLKPGLSSTVESYKQNKSCKTGSLIAGFPIMLMRTLLIWTATQCVVLELPLHTA
jgi:hypothetical protein